MVYGDEVHKVAVGQREEIKNAIFGQEYGFASIHPFQGKDGRTRDGGLFYLPPFTISNTAAIVEPGFVCEDVVFSGEGLILIDSEDLEVPQIETVNLPSPKVILAGSENPSPIRYGYGSIITYISANKPLNILGLYNPPYEERYEVVASHFGQRTIGGFRVKHIYWRALGTLAGTLNLKVQSGK